ncbi:hypothetical protein [Sphingomonas carotinifaciens]|uniref:Uncharacterized protein n=1 Tax=Sphingomonas carotinifaciens TaxID=1166323 RepID=A0A6N8LTM7_9SPHN|nr:hypothetical protein [Sphingomonas carotinifaciens]MBB4088198.1 hypothetical protein [Sphingomonas carotinifaciens]MWC42412.1 hypothetical protein [Sphingomonas carotinifaciens]MWC42429.1 hypothetical protein [Sphingomonas carotinifaciens]
MITSEYFLVSAEIEVDGSREKIELPGLSALPSVGDEVELNYWHGRKLTFVVEGVRHHIANIGEKMLQQTVLIGRPI